MDYSGSAAHNAAKRSRKIIRACSESMTVPEDKALLAIQLLIEGASIRSAERITQFPRHNPSPIGACW